LLNITTYATILESDGMIYWGGGLHMHFAFTSINIILFLGLLIGVFAIFYLIISILYKINKKLDKNIPW